MSRNIAPLAPEGVPEALSLVVACYESEKRCNPLMPPTLLGNPDNALPYIEQCMGNGCVAAYDGGKMIGFMGIHAFFTFKGQRAAQVRSINHAALEKTPNAYLSLYQALGEVLAEKRVQLHIIEHLAGNMELKETLFQLGFGAILAERLRDMSPIPSAAAAAVSQEKDFLSIEELDLEHRRYYRLSPIFITKDESRKAVRGDLSEHGKNGDVLFTYRENGIPMAYMIAGAYAGTDEGFLLQNSGTAQVKSAYARPDARAKGIGRALLSHSVEWARLQGYSRIFVEHESANIIGGAFWQQHFSPYLYVSMRYVEDCSRA
jgi:GNAT superfamily N-acetyltransferase